MMRRKLLTAITIGISVHSVSCGHLANVLCEKRLHRETMADIHNEEPIAENVIIGNRG